jgi:hypothetical protein
MNKIVNDLAPARASQSAYFDVAALFEEAAGLPPKIFEALMIGILPRIMQSATDSMTRSLYYGAHIDFFEQSRLEPKHRARLPVGKINPLVRRGGKQLEPLSASAAAPFY